ncbi:ricin-type beta-trefoil lectin domain protein [Nonomuraea lactucae]|uniref:ricin-type beta-trefoil lectin domain protein n=1 Tax=Nonomuraea lactucae TaxID=2249762 RepID=UPI0019635240|nr:ricin-type beta-trefoil lectin domain protein [Nonomuraea lactucae]
MAAAFAVAPVPPTQAALEPPPTDPAVESVPEGMLAAMRRDLGVTDAQARERLRDEAEARKTEKSLRASLGGRFSGAWLTSGGARLVVAGTDPASEAVVRAAGAEFRLVQRSADRLGRAMSLLDKNAKRAGPRVHSWRVDVPSNRVVVQSEDQESGERFVRDSDVSADDVRVVAVPGGGPKPGANLIGGERYNFSVGTGAANCSVGFAVPGGFLTAGHCGAVAGGVGAPTTGANGASQGRFLGVSFPDNDYAWVGVNADWAPIPWVTDHNNGVIPVTGSEEATIGSSICRSGATTGWRCGTVKAKNVTLDYDSPPAIGTVYGLTETSACAAGGDSGGPYLSGNQAQGLMSGYAFPCDTDWATSWFQPVNEALDAYGLTLKAFGGRNAGRLIGLGNRCIDVPNGNAADGQYLHVWDCNGTNWQTWWWPGDGTVRALGLCMDVAGGAVNNGATVQVARCSGGPAQQFVMNNGELVNPQSKKCVDIRGGGSGNGGRLQIWDCHGGGNQKWRHG